GHAGHVPVGDHQVERTLAQLHQRRGAVVGLDRVEEPQAVEQVLDDATHGREVVDDEDADVLVHADLVLRNGWGVPWPGQGRWSSPSPASRRQSASRARRRAAAWPWLWHTRVSLAPRTAPLSRRFSSCSEYSDS